MQNICRAYSVTYLSLICERMGRSLISCTWRDCGEKRYEEAGTGKSTQGLGSTPAVATGTSCKEGATGAGQGVQNVNEERLNDYAWEAASVAAMLVAMGLTLAIGILTQLW
ncbi:hypothetical protein GF340_00900 [Candidatus Peregrinibacteria bacterium]|nr:hypothetical protein [Candidatus Peregrinibacteria bacterium]